MTSSNILLGTKRVNIGAVIVSTPQDIALRDAMKGVSMFQKVSVPVLGMVQNMSVFVCPYCSQRTHVFGSEGVSRKCKEHGIKLLGDLPLDARICDDADRGKPTVISEPHSERAKAFNSLAEEIRHDLSFQVGRK